MCVSFNLKRFSVRSIVKTILRFSWLCNWIIAMKKCGRQVSLRRKCFRRPSQLLLGQSPSVDEYCSVPNNDAALCTLPSLNVENTDSNMPSKSQRKSGSTMINSISGDLCLPQCYPTLNQSVSGSSIDSGFSGLSRTSSLTSLPPSKRCSAESSSPLVESRRLLSLNRAEVDPIGTEKTNNLSKERGSRVSIDSAGGRILDSEDKISPTIDEAVLSERTQRLSISVEVLDNLLIATQRVVEDAQQSTVNNSQLGPSPPLSQFADVDSEMDGPCHFTIRRHSSADPYIPLTQRPIKQAERKRSTQPSFHRYSASSRFGATEVGDGRSSDKPRARKISACIVCERRNREPTRSAPSVIIKTAMTFVDHQKRRRFSDTLKVPCM